MPGVVLVSPALMDKVDCEAQALGDPLPSTPGIILATPSDLARANPFSLSSSLIITVGDGQLDELLTPFLQLPADASLSAIGKAIAAAQMIVSLRKQVEEREREATIACERQLDLARVGIALTVEHDLDRLLQLILTTARELVSADAGSLYLIEEQEGKRLLRFVLAQNDSVEISLVTSTMALDSTSLAGYVALTGEVVTLDDARVLPEGVPYSFNFRVDSAIGYHTRSLLTTPIATRAGDVIGVLQLINRKIVGRAQITDVETADSAVGPFGPKEVAVIRALAAQAAVAIENTRLVQEIERLFEGFVKAAVRAIEQRDPATSGHSQRVAHYTVELARAVEKNPPPAYKNLSFSTDDITQLRYAALLHDFGKVGVREAVLTKEKKLYPDRLVAIQERFRHAYRAKEVGFLLELLETLKREGLAPTAADFEKIEIGAQRFADELSQYLAAILRANEPAYLASETAQLIEVVRNASFPGDEGITLPLLFKEEARALSIPKGTLVEEERLEIESHVVHSYEFLRRIPWPRRYARVPQIAFGHHEKVNGRGYPGGLPGDAISAEAKIMAVCDIFDALTALDRPYKRAVPVERVLTILEEEARGGLIDVDLVKVFIDAKIYQIPMDDSLTR